MKLTPEFFQRDVLLVAPDLLGKIIVRKFENGDVGRFRITEVEAYRGEEDKACHAAKGRTKRTEIMYHEGGRIYVYFIYGMYWMLNFVTGKENQPQAVLIRGVEGYSGPGKLTKRLRIDSRFYGQSVLSENLWIEDDGFHPRYKQTPRVGINYAGEWKDRPWRFVEMKNEE